MIRVVIESPYSGDVERNVKYARACIRDSLSRGEAPIASHLLYTQPGVLDDNVPEERAWGIDAGHEWIQVANLVAIYQDLGVTQGMEMGMKKAMFIPGMTVTFRSLGAEALAKLGIHKPQA